MRGPSASSRAPRFCLSRSSIAARSSAFHQLIDQDLEQHGRGTAALLDPLAGEQRAQDVEVLLQLDALGLEKFAIVGLGHAEVVMPAGQGRKELA